MKPTFKYSPSELQLISVLYAAKMYIESRQAFNRYGFKQALGRCIRPTRHPQIVYYDMTIEEKIAARIKEKMIHLANINEDYAFALIPNAKSGKDFNSPFIIWDEA